MRDLPAVAGVRAIECSLHCVQRAPAQCRGMDSVSARGRSDERVKAERAALMKERTRLETYALSQDRVGDVVGPSK